MLVAPACFIRVVIQRPSEILIDFSVSECTAK